MTRALQDNLTFIQCCYDTIFIQLMRLIDSLCVTIPMWLHHDKMTFFAKNDNQLVLDREKWNVPTCPTFPCVKKKIIKPFQTPTIPNISREALYQHHYYISRWPDSTSVTKQISSAEVVRIWDLWKKYDDIIGSRVTAASEISSKRGRSGGEGSSVTTSVDSS